MVIVIASAEDLDSVRQSCLSSDSSLTGLRFVHCVQKKYCQNFLLFSPRVTYSHTHCHKPLCCQSWTTNSTHERLDGLGAEAVVSLVPALARSTVLRDIWYRRWFCLTISHTTMILTFLFAMDGTKDGEQQFRRGRHASHRWRTQN